MILKASGYSQSRHLPTFFIVLIPIICGLLEGAPPSHPPEHVSTRATLPAAPAAAWDSIVFYEEVKHDPPLILKIGLAHPLFTEGSSSSVGDVKICVYNKGRIVKKITEAAPPRVLAFEVIEQRIGYERDVLIRAGKFEFTAVDEQHTDVVLTTQYTPLLTPR